MKPNTIPPVAPGSGDVAPFVPEHAALHISDSVPDSTPVGTGKPAEAGPPDISELPNFPMEHLLFLLDEEEDNQPFDLFA